jgi:5-methyltetrahydropteroyltriglutamate--homocysteine methyltransferase
LIRLGCTYIQIDSPQYTALLDPTLREGYRQRGNDPDRLLDLSIEMDNAVISNHPGVTFGLHLCRGNNQSKFYAEGDYGPITRVFRNTRFQRFLLEYDDARSGGFEPLAQVPGQNRLLLVGSKKATLEHGDGESAPQRGFDLLSRSTHLIQCGFASVLGQPAGSRRGGQTATRSPNGREVWGQ